MPCEDGNSTFGASSAVMNILVGLVEETISKVPFTKEALERRLETIN